MQTDSASIDLLFPRGSAMSDNPLTTQMVLYMLGDPPSVKETLGDTKQIYPVMHHDAFDKLVAVSSDNLTEINTVLADLERTFSNLVGRGENPGITFIIYSPYNDFLDETYRTAKCVKDEIERIVNCETLAPADENFVGFFIAKQNPVGNTYTRYNSVVVDLKDMEKVNISLFGDTRNHTLYRINQCLSRTP